jgi:hypothetical protein
MTKKSPALPNRQLLLIACCVVFTIALMGCKKGASSTPVVKRPKIDVCGLITNDEIAAVEQAPVKDSKASEQSDGSFRYAQCFYTTDPFNKSVSLAVTQADPQSPKPRNPKDFWKDTFGRYEGGAKEEEGDKEKKLNLEELEEHTGAKEPKKIDGVGDGAYWTANRMGGALYVLKNDVFIRVSIGGPGTEEERMNHCKALAEKALSRL